MPRFGSKNMRAVAFSLALLAPTTVGVIYSPTLYRIFCAATGYGGLVQRSDKVLHADAPVSGKTFTVFFDSNVAPGLPWEFRPEQRSVVVTPGVPKKIYYYAKNRSDKPLVARATYNVVPEGVAPYFFKIECFCFTEERLGPGESARMPVVFYIDEQVLKDRDASRIDEVNLSYTFFPQDQLSLAKARAARDLSAGSKALDEKLQKSKSASFENDKPVRR